MYFYTQRVSSGDGEEHQHSLQYSYYSGCVCCLDGLAAVLLIASQIYRYNTVRMLCSMKTQGQETS